MAKLRTGNSNIRNPILVSYIAKGLLPYRGLGSGIKRALEDWPEIDFNDDREGSLFTATIHRKPGVGSVEPDAGSGKVRQEEKVPRKVPRRVPRKSSISCRAIRRSPLPTLLRP